MRSDNLPTFFLMKEYTINRSLDKYKRDCQGQPLFITTQKWKKLIKESNYLVSLTRPVIYFGVEDAIVFVKHFPVDEYFFIVGG